MKYLAFVYTSNQFKVLQAIRNQGIYFPALIFNNCHGSYKLLKNDVVVSNKIIFKALFANNKSWKILFKVCKDEKLSKNSYRVILLTALGFIYEKLITKNFTIVNFNDHHYYNVLLVDVAKKKGANTIYVQHAPVSDKFPALYHDENILFSQDSLDKYKIDNKSIVTHTLCDLRLLSVEKDNGEPKERSVLICTNKLDSVEATHKLIQELHDYSITIRPHPNDDRNWKIGNVQISRNRSLWDDLNNNEIVVTNESAVPLEALFVGRKVYKACFLSDSLDNYGFLKQGLITKEHNNVASLAEAIRNNNEDFDRSKLSYFIGNADNVKQELGGIFKGAEIV